MRALEEGKERGKNNMRHQLESLAQIKCLLKE